MNNEEHYQNRKQSRKRTMGRHQQIQLLMPEFRSGQLAHLLETSSVIQRKLSSDFRNQKLGNDILRFIVYVPTPVLIKENSAPRLYEAQENFEDYGSAHIDKNSSHTLPSISWGSHVHTR